MSARNRLAWSFWSSFAALWITFLAYFAVALHLNSPEPVKEVVALGLNPDELTKLLGKPDEIINSEVDPIWVYYLGKPSQNQSARVIVFQEGVANEDYVVDLRKDRVGK